MMISPITTIAATQHSTATENVIPLSERIPQHALAVSATEESTELPEAAPDINEDLLTHAFLDELRQLAPSEDPREYANAVSQLMRDFVDPTTQQRAFVTLEQQLALLQRTLAEVGDDPTLTKPLTTVMLGTANVKLEMTKWMQDTVLSGGEITEFEEW
ncbi:hypothetical protein GBN32_00840 [Plesiomonas shigelloides]|uniref:hypothetical protein n=1 Tax=Plesiomonas shigelloides TaxID=703 RepID=UPI0012618187|nr:hypothetical protein [Plesiomonas shigelloides]KAB7715284.1 hypothetical protein GBN32_00840 [Plesiomonas shigelloides]